MGMISWVTVGVSAMYMNTIFSLDKSMLLFIPLLQHDGNR
jgi:hypothetical protein